MRLAAGFWMFAFAGMTFIIFAVCQAHYLAKSQKKSAFICFNPRHPRIYSNFLLACLPREKGILSFYPTLAMVKGGASAVAQVH